MDILGILIQQLAGGAASQAGNALWRWGSDKISAFFKARQKQEVGELLRELGVITPQEIRELVSRELQGKAVPPERKDELTRLLLHLARGTRLVTSQGTAPLAGDGADLIERILQYLKPVRRAGEEVSPALREWALEQFLGMGTFGEVWLGRHKHSPTLHYAFKFFTHEGAKEWLHREQRQLAAAQKALQSEPNLVRMISLAVDKERYPYLMLEYLPGGTLEDWILERTSERRTAIRKDDVIRGIVRTMARAHEHGIAHRDLKPANVLLTAGPNAQPKIGDFGLADVRDQAGPRQGAGLRGSLYGAHAAAMVGTPMYWPPEAWVPTSRRDAKQDDVFAIGVIWYQMLVEKLERPPYDFAQTLRAAGQDSQTISLVSRCLAGPDRRFRDVGELETELHGTAPPVWPPVPTGHFDVSLLVKEYLAQADA